MKISIIGGGIGGLTLAIALQQRGIAAHVYEAAAELRPVGKGIWLPTNGMLVMERLGLADILVGQGIELERIEVHDQKQGRLQTIDLGVIKKQFGRTTTSILRADLQATLAAQIPAAQIHLGKRCTAVSQTPHTVTATFADGSNATSDLLIGADGLRSVVREQVAPAHPLRYSGQTCYLGLADIALPDDLLRVVREIWGGRLRFGYSAVAAERVYWFAPQTAPAGAPPPAAPRVELLRAYADFPAPVREIIGKTDEAEMMKVDLHDIRPLQKWADGRLALLGDAAHGMTPNMGQGGAQAIEDAFALAHLLVESSDHQTAFSAYTALRQPKAHRVAALSRRFGQLAHLASPLLCTVRNGAFRLLPAGVNQRQAAALYRLDF
jgi:2-polyprenyl-6-methoxyphenol hydroxylase-like FAD-dependent oxidoreductase